MADYYTQCSFMVDAGPKVCQWILDVWQGCAEGTGGPFIRKLIEKHEYFTACMELQPTGLWIHDDGEGINLEAVADIIQLALAKFKSNKVIVFSYAGTCSRPRLDACCGGTLAVSRKSIKCKGTWNLESELRKQLEKEIKSTRVQRKN